MGKSDKFILSDGSVELLKWVAVCLMVVDHVNKYLFGEAYPVMFSFGRLVLPIFVVVLAYNLSRDDGLRKGVYLRAMKRMVIFGLLATPAFVGLGGDLALVKDGQELWWILNILFTLALLTWCLYCFDRGQTDNYWNWVGWGSFLFGGAFVEFWWGALGLGIAVWLYYKNLDSGVTWSLLGFSLFFLLVVNIGNWWFLMAFPLIYLASKIPVQITRMKWFFYGFYPVHLSIIWWIKHYML
ncbi:TraX family protein [sulfur-oxidizing endosymbiont of Gigantopelta aegis]|uniref:TraX family protein n=1 Tax=sulfur-oxidizing endosymbiont of Gigantopelta aegis TaxID=2794934 RepID=UPI0018DE8F95|nr:TraX family protein [sulfur-oxidizing endosymbiont of Gigantopelta aegis]